LVQNKIFFVYLLQSIKDSSTYIGFTNDIKKRIEYHNSGKVSYTNKHKPYKLVYYEAYLSEKDARQREINLKNKGGQRDFLKENLENSLQ